MLIYVCVVLQDAVAGFGRTSVTVICVLLLKKSLNLSAASCCRTLWLGMGRPQ